MINIYTTILPVVLSGVANMLFTRTALYKNNAKPIDFGRKLGDGKDVFGKNKTWIGFLSMVVFACVIQVIWGFLCGVFDIEQYNDLYTNAQNTVAFNAVAGLLMGFAYMLFELPNSFIKRRLSINPGKGAKGIKGAVFFVVDRFDSVIGVALALILLGAIDVQRAVIYVLVGALTHIGVNLILLRLRVRDNI